MYAAALMVLNLAIVCFIQPYVEYAYEGLEFELRSSALGASIKVGEFNKLGERMTLRVERSESEGRDLHGVFVRAESRDGRTLAVTRSEEHTSELQSLMRNSYAVFCLKQKKKKNKK